MRVSVCVCVGGGGGGGGGIGGASPPQMLPNAPSNKIRSKKMYVQHL